MSTNKNKLKEGFFFTAFKQAIVVSINIIGFIGLILIIYSLIADYFNNSWEILDKLADEISKYFTLFGVILTSMSIYFPINQRKPEAFSKLFSAPIVILFAMTTILVSVFGIYSVPRNVINGFALLAISGALFRLISR